MELRRYRMGLIQTFDQLFFSYQAIIDGIKHLNDPVSIAVLKPVTKPISVICFRRKLMHLII